MKKHQMNPDNGKGSAYRTVDVRKFHSEFDRIFGAPKKNKPAEKKS